MAKVSNITHDESIQQNLEGWCFEVGSEYENYSIAAANLFIEYIGTKPVIDLGSGDGAATKVFVANGNKTTAVDINSEKLNRIEGAKLVQTDFMSFLSKPLDNIFLHHSLEHYVNYQDVLDAIASHLKKGSYCYIAVPKGDTPHSVHHVAFESVDEICPPGLEVIECTESEKPWPQYYAITKKQ